MKNADNYRCAVFFSGEHFHVFFYSRPFFSVCHERLSLMLLHLQTGRWSCRTGAPPQPAPVSEQTNFGTFPVSSSFFKRVTPTTLPPSGLEQVFFPLLSLLPRWTALRLALWDFSPIFLPRIFFFFFFVFFFSFFLLARDRASCFYLAAGNLSFADAWGCLNL